MKILVIDDEKPTLSMFNLFLAAYGYEVFIAENGEKGLKLFNDQAPDIVFTDIKMPGIDGLEVLKRIRETKIPTQVIIITGHGDMEKAVEALDLDASDFINKPVERQALNAALSRAEKRQQSPYKPHFSILENMEKNKLTLKVSGKMTNDAKLIFENSLFKNDKEQKLNGVNEVCFYMDDSFSINRSGITYLTQLLQDLKQKGIPVVLENISYNYARVFQMVGISKIATISEAVAED